MGSDEFGGQLVEDVLVDTSGDDRHDGGVAQVAGGCGRQAGLDDAVRGRRGVAGPGIRPGGFGQDGALVWGLVLAGEFFEADMELDLGRLSGAVGEAAAGDQPPAEASSSAS